MKTSLDSDFDWVSARQNCSTFKSFQRLKYEIDRDIVARNSGLTRKEKEDLIGFSLDAVSSDCFAVHRSGPGIVASVVFKCSESSFVVQNDESEVILEGTLSLNDQGRCVLLVDLAELEMWQFRRRALEKLFFWKENAAR